MSSIYEYSQDEIGEYTIIIGNMILAKQSPQTSAFFSPCIESMIVQILKANEMIDLNALLLMACQKNNEHLVMSLLKMGASMESRSQIDSTPIMFIAQQGNVPMMKYFIDNGANVFAQNQRGLSVLNYATGNSPMYTYLQSVVAEQKKSHEIIAKENQALKEKLMELERQLQSGGMAVDDGRRKIPRKVEVEMQEVHGVAME